jgi:GrpB-like predicted nucleotidyltransferase (UPF0157 family)
MNRHELGKLYPVFLSSYDTGWPSLFRKEKNILEDIFNLRLRIEHIGSTSVPGLIAKPTIDILMELPPDKSRNQIIKTMENRGYIHMKEQTKHLMFVKGYSQSGLEKKSYHIHIGPLGQHWLWDRIYFRDYLIMHPDEAGEYEKLKTKLAEKYKHDREKYTEGKEEYIKNITEKAKREFYI